MTLIATWNVNSIRTRLMHLETWLKERQPDIVLLQELKCVEGDFPREHIEDLGYNCAVFGQKSYNGVAILSKSPLEDITCGLPTFAHDPEARYIEAFTAGLRVASVYVPNGQEVGSPKYAYKLNFFKALAQHTKTLLSFNEPLILGGDYNVAPYLEDAHNPRRFEANEILCSLDEREHLNSLINLGLVDGLRLQFPREQKIFTWWDYRGGSFERDKGYRIDHMLLSPQAADLFQEAGVDTNTRGRDKPSDHAPVWIQVGLSITRS
jgi:exodeoxyribonuclease-3